MHTINFKVLLSPKNEKKNLKVKVKDPYIIIDLNIHILLTIHIVYLFIAD